MDIHKMKRKDFEALPNRRWDEDIGEFDTLIVLPLRSRHDSGYRCMDFVAVIKDKPICRLSGCSDVIQIDGVGGLGSNWATRYGRVPKSVPPTGWSIDCLPVSGLLRMFCQGKIRVGVGLSSFEIYQVPREKEGS